LKKGIALFIIALLVISFTSAFTLAPESHQYLEIKKNLTTLSRQHPHIFWYQLNTLATWGEYDQACLDDFIQKYELQGDLDLVSVLKVLERAAKGEQVAPWQMTHKINLNLDTLEGLYPDVFINKKTSDFNVSLEEKLAIFLDAYNIESQHTTTHERLYLLQQAAKGERALDVSYHLEAINMSGYWQGREISLDGTTQLKLVQVVNGKVFRIIEDVFYALSPNIPSEIHRLEGNQLTVNPIKSSDVFTISAQYQSRQVASLVVTPQKNSQLYKGHVMELYIDRPVFFVNGSMRLIDEQPEVVPYIVSDRTVLPIRAVIEAIGGQIEWDAVERRVAINYMNSVVFLWIDRHEVSKNGRVEPLEVAPFIVHNRTYLPLRAVAELLGFEVSWDAIKRKVTLKM